MLCCAQEEPTTASAIVGRCAGIRKWDICATDVKGPLAMFPKGGCTRAGRLGTAVFGGGLLLAPEGEPDDDEDNQADQRDPLNHAHKRILKRSRN